ncbi:hypothetical protein RD792_016630 [Penstemon davidsonii]|uniref:Uncharacterized protein n=1 Tax=Penstemon davidsonii TaxID=160366 RepID=A0ABR0CJW3_9LAMI|nr:hypothetical protein RD792_016630 [Penstemon davidsonii]
MEKEQELEWKEAQSTAINVDLVSAAKTQLKFLAAVDKNRWLCEGPGPLVVPFDCELVWHCHRLNPVRYKSDCEEFYGRILDNQNVVSSMKGTSRMATEEIWKTLYPDEPFELDSASALEDNIVPKAVEKCTTYDLISAVQRQSPFLYQVSRPHMNDDHYIEGAVARYKAFLHLIKRNKERSIDSFSVPTYDIDLIWHSHQLHPMSYCKDLIEIIGDVLNHDDTVSDRTKGQKLDTGFSLTTKLFEEMYGSRYWRAGGMFRGTAPSPVRTTPYSGNAVKKPPTCNNGQIVKLSKIKVFEVMLEFVGVRNLPEEHKGSVLVYFSKTQPDQIFDVKRSLTIFSETGEKNVASFQCEPTGHLLFELTSSLPSSLPRVKSSKTLGTTSLSLDDFLSPESILTVEKWLDLVPSSNVTNSKPISLRVAISVTIPTPAPYVLHMTRSSAFPKLSWLFPLTKTRTCVTDEAGNLVMSLEMRDLKKAQGEKECRRREVVGIMESGETRILAEFAESEWSIVNSSWSLQFPSRNNDDGHLLELTGPQTIRLFPGGKLDYETRRCGKHKHEHEQLERCQFTAVEFSAEDPYGRAVALLDLKSGTVKVKEEWFLLPGFILAFILGDIVKKEGYDSLIVGSKCLKEKDLSNEVGTGTNLALVPKEVDLNVEAAK